MVVEKRVCRRKEDVLAAVESDVSNACFEAVGNKIEMMIGAPYRFRSVGRLIELFALKRSCVRFQRPVAVR
ncbi:hypothetical protein [Adlercreutzia equolifaciens]|uniref:hypothetical protein n=1 Tax=Adlercreutzia equolifaciens TaxID=446660 RepID=UPI0005A17BB4|nr:hypothetical protein [Adlercreutzia equolifaciens]RFT81021.1 hypothetical protein DX903_08710 [Adlercreutzia equolifaciens]